MADEVPTRRLRAAYEGVEAPDGFDSPNALAAYRSGLLARTQAEAAYISRHAPTRPFTFLEACSGNGRLLHRLAIDGHLERGEGWEIARSRVAFAQAWAHDLGLGPTVRHVCADALRPPPGPSDFDAAACLTGALGYFDALEDGGALRLLRTLRQRMRPGGLLVLETYPHPKELALCRAAPDQEARTWLELEPTDPWRFYLSHYRWDPTRSFLHHRKIFVHRGTGRIDDDRAEVLRIWRRDELDALVRSADFEPHRFDGGWDGQPYTDGQSDRLIVSAWAR